MYSRLSDFSLRARRSLARLLMALPTHPLFSLARSLRVYLLLIIHLSQAARRQRPLPSFLLERPNAVKGDPRERGGSERSGERRGEGERRRTFFLDVFRTLPSASGHPSVDLVGLTGMKNWSRGS